MFTKKKQKTKELLIKAAVRSWSFQPSEMNFHKIGTRPCEIFPSVNDSGEKYAKSWQSVKSTTQEERHFLQFEKSKGNANYSARSDRESIQGAKLLKKKERTKELVITKAAVRSSSFQPSEMNFNKIVKRPCEIFPSINDSGAKYAKSWQSAKSTTQEELEALYFEKSKQNINNSVCSAREGMIFNSWKPKQI